MDTKYFRQYLFKLNVNEKVMSKEQYTHVGLQNRQRCLKVCDDKRNVNASNSFFYNVGCEEWKDRRKPIY
jgi:hypothetical protein